MTVDQERTLVWPDGTVYTITRSTDETGGSELEMERELPADGLAPQAHVHPDLPEEYAVLEGSVGILGHEWRTLSRGEAAAVPPGTVHTFRTGPAPALGPPSVCSFGTSYSSARAGGQQRPIRVACLARAKSRARQSFRSRSSSSPSSAV